MDISMKVNDLFQLVNNMPGMVFQCRHNPPNFTFTFVSEGCEPLTGYTQDEFLGDLSDDSSDDNTIKFLDIVHPDDIQEIENLIMTTLPQGLPFETTFRIITKDKTEKRVLVRSRITETDNKGLPYLIEGFYTDITKPLRVDIATLANQAKIEFLAKLSQEIRTPMNAVIGMAELGLREDMPEKVREYTLEIKQAGSKLVSALNSIWDFTQIENSELEIIDEKYSLSTLLNEVIFNTAKQLEPLPIEFIVSIDSNIPNELVGDGARLRQIILNVLSNAIKFTDVGFISLTINGKVLGNMLTLEIVIEDSGRGIKEEDIGNLFKEYMQFDSKNIEGIGLGLVIIYNLVKLMGGEINVSSIFGLGSIFTITLSQQISSHEKIGSITIPKDCQEDSHTSHGNGINNVAYVKFIAPEARVLIVDDISANLKVAQGLLAPYKMILDFCETGAEAIEAVKYNHYDLILMDYLMPIMSGLEASVRIKELKNIPIVALTANATTGAKAMFLQNGFDDFLTKPIDMAMLNETIEKWIPKEKQTSISDIPPTDDIVICDMKNTDLKISGIDIDRGIAMTGGLLDNYLEILKAYYGNCRKKLDELKDCIVRGDMELYRVNVHAIKGVSSNIGAFAVACAAEALELAEEQGDYTFIHENSSHFFDELEALLDNIHPIIYKQMDDVDSQDTNIEVIKVVLKKLKDAMVNRNSALINEYASNMQQYLFSDVGHIINKIMQCKMLGEYDEAIALIDDIL